MSLILVTKFYNISLQCPSIIHKNQLLICNLAIFTYGLQYETAVNFGDGDIQKYYEIDKTFQVSKIYQTSGNYTINSTIDNQKYSVSPINGLFLLYFILH